MNLIGDPWIPVLFQNNQSGLVSLQDAFDKGEEILDLVATPPQRIALMRLLLCVAHAALDGPQDEAARRSCKPLLRSKVKTYLSNHQQDFELYSERGKSAFLQVPNLETTENAVVDKLDFSLAAGNNSTLFDHEAGPEGRDIPDAQRVVALLTYQCFSSGGTIGVTKWGNKSTDSKKEKGPGTSEHAPCLGGTPLHLLIRSHNLLDTVYNNLLTREILKSLPNFRWGRPVWEKMPSSPDDSIVEELSTSYLGRLVPISRAIKMSPESTKLTLANGINYPKFPEFREPNATVIQRKGGTQGYLGIDLSKHVWRELVSLLTTSSSRTEGRALPLALLASSKVEEEGEEKVIEVWTGGLVADKGKVIDVAEWNLHLHLSMLGESALRKYEKGVELANSASHLLAKAVSAYFCDLGVSEFKQSDQATGWYWGRLNHQYPILMDIAIVPESKLNDGWYPIIFRELKESYRRTCPHETPRQIRAYAKGEALLRLKKLEE